MQNPFRKPHEPPSVNFNRARTKVNDLIEPDARRDFIIVTIAAVDAEMARNSAKIVAEQKHLHTLARHPGNKQGAEIHGRGYRLLGLTFGVAGLPVQYTVNNGAFGEYGMPVVIASAIGMELFFVGLGAGVLRAVNNPSEPAQTIRLGKFVSLAATGILFVAAATAAYARFSSAGTSDRFFDLAAVAMWTVAELAPAACGLWVTLAELTAYPVQVEAGIVARRERQSALTKFRAWLGEELEKIEPENSKPAGESIPPTGEVRIGESDGDKGSAPGVAKKMAGLTLAALALSGAAASAQTACGVSSERSIAGVATSRIQAIDNTLGTLGEWTARFGCSVVIAGSYAEAGPFTARVALPVPRRQTVDCTVNHPVQSDRLRGGLKVFPGYRDKLRANADSSCAAERTRLDSLYSERWRTFIRNARTVLGQSQLTVPSHIDAAGEIKAYAEAGVRNLLLITTGLDLASGIPERLPAGMHVVLVIFEVKERFLGRAATDAASERWRKAGATVISYPLVTPGVWTRIMLASEG